MTGELGVRIVTEIAEREGVDPTSLTPPLHDVIDPDALESLFEPTPLSERDAAGSVSFTYNGYDVTVSASGEVTVQEVRGVTTNADTGQETAID